MAAITIEDLHYRYPPLAGLPEQPAVLRGIDLEVAEGEFLSLMGPTGAGKTTLCMALNGLVPQTTGGTIRGRVRVLGQDSPRRAGAAAGRSRGHGLPGPRKPALCHHGGG